MRWRRRRRRTGDHGRGDRDDRRQRDDRGQRDHRGAETTDGRGDDGDGHDDHRGGATPTTAGGQRPAGAGALEGLKGTTPLVELSPGLQGPAAGGRPARSTDYNYAAETYDAITIIALAVEQAQDDGIAYAAKINGITRDGEKCTDFASCKAIIDAGGDPDYDGFSGPLEFAGNGEPLEASYGLLTFGADNRIDDALTEYLPATAPAEADVPQQVPVEGTRAGDGVLTIGSILPQTGNAGVPRTTRVRGVRPGHQGHQRRRWRARQADVVGHPG